MKGRLYTKKEERIIRKEFNVTDLNELAERLGRTPYAIIQHAREMGIPKIRVSKAWPPEKVEKLKELYPYHSNKEIALLLGTTPGNVNNAAFKFGLRKDPQWKYEMAKKGMFKKGHVPSNKGKKWDEYVSKESQEKSRATTFQTGHRPRNAKNVGYERVNKEGYVEVKVAEPNVFKLKHRILWEEHYGPIPEGMHVCFKDGDRTNLDIENLFLESMRDKFNRCCSIHTRYPKEIQYLIHLKGALKRQINKQGNHENRQSARQGGQTR